jgi:hypothetical protein
MENTVIPRFSKGRLCGHQTKSIELPEDKCLPGRENAKLPYFFVGDEAFALYRNLLRPYGGKEKPI